MDKGKGFKERVLTRWLPVMLGLAGVYGICGMWWGIATRYEFKEVFDVLFLFIFPLPMTGFGVYVIYIGIKLWRGISSQVIRQLSGIGGVILGVIISSLILPYNRGGVLGKWQSREMFLAPVMMIAAGVIYLLVKKGLFKWLGMEEELDYVSHAKGVKHYFGWLSFFMWSAAVNILIHYYKEQSDMPCIGLLFILAPLFLSYFLIYRLGVRLFLGKQSEEEPGNAGREAQRESLQG